MGFDNREKIREEAKQILDNFAHALDNVKVKEERVKNGIGGYRKEGRGYRKEGAGQKCDANFRERMFSNAPKKDGDYIIVERKKW